MTPCPDCGTMNPDDAETCSNCGMSLRSLEQRAVWSTAYINSLPDSAFLHIEAGGSKDSEGKTTPRSLRHWPVRDASGNLDVAHVRDALSRIPQTMGVSQAVKDAAAAKARKMLSSLNEGSSHPAVPEIERRSSPLEGVSFEESADGTLRFSGMAAVFDSWSEPLGASGFREKIQRGAFRKPLRQNPDVRLLINHNPDLVVARSTIRSGPGSLRLEELSRGLGVEADLAPTTAALDLRTLTQTGVVDQMSFGFTMRGGKDTWDEDPQGTMERTLVEIGSIFDVSAVTYPAYPATSASMRSVACGVEIVDDEGVVQEDLLDVMAARVHRGTQHATAEERARLDQAYASVNRLSPWMEELARRALGIESASPASSTAEGDGGSEPAVAVKRRRAERRLKMATLD